MGVDLNKAAVEDCKRKLLQAVCMDIEDYAKKCKEKYDLIVLSEMIEHLSSPTQIIKVGSSLLKKGGMF